MIRDAIIFHAADAAPFADHTIYFAYVTIRHAFTNITTPLLSLRLRRRR